MGTSVVQAEIESEGSSLKESEVTLSMAKGLLELYEPPLTTISTHLKELTEKQESVHNILTSERRRLEDLQNDAMLDALLASIATNKEKLVSMSSTMLSLHKRVQALQVRAANIHRAAWNKAASSKPAISAKPTSSSESAASSK